MSQTTETAPSAAPAPAPAPKAERMLNVQLDSPRRYNFQGFVYEKGTIYEVPFGTGSRLPADHFSLANADEVEEAKALGKYVTYAKQIEPPKAPKKIAMKVIKVRAKGAKLGDEIAPPGESGPSVAV